MRSQRKLIIIMRLVSTNHEHKEPTVVHVNQLTSAVVWWAVDNGWWKITRLI